MRTPESRSIEGLLYTVTPLGATQGAKVFTLFGRAAGPAIKALSSSKGDGAEALATLLANLKEEDVETLCQVFGRVTTVTVESGKAPVLADIFDAHFAANYMALVKWLAFCVEVNYGSFLAGVGLSLKPSGASAKPAPTPGA